MDLTLREEYWIKFCYEVEMRVNNMKNPNRKRNEFEAPV
jgi:hypothetical protein